jgi:hypothetical protein
MQAEVLLLFYTTKASPMNWIFGGVSGRMIGRPGGRLYQIALVTSFNYTLTLSTVAPIPRSVIASHIGFSSS